jgi:hypothetical protein
MKEIAIISAAWKCHVYVGAANDDGTKDSVNLNASSGQRTPLLKLQSLGYKIPKIAKRNEEGEYESKESLAELSLQKLLSANQFGIPGGDPVIKALLKIRELVTLKNRYINARLYYRNGSFYYLSSYNVAGTTTGRRASKKHVFGFGNNGQNLPARGEEAAIFKRCLVSHPGKILLFVDQMQAEDWPVSALAGNLNALTELRDGIDRHTKLASMLFNISQAQVTKDQRFLGKKVRHASNYDMREVTMSDSLAAEGYSIPPPVCRFLLDSIAKIDPSVKGVFHNYVQQQLYSTRTLRNPFGRERQFFGLRAGDSGSNQKVFRDAYAFIPQSAVADNTGFAVFLLESQARGKIIQEGHDSLIQEVDDNLNAIGRAIRNTIDAFDREMSFDNGISLKIPIEGKIGFDFNTTVTLKNNDTGSKRLSDISFTDLEEAYEQLRAISETRGEDIREEIDNEHSESESESNTEKAAS